MNEKNTILIVDDTPDNITLLNNLLKDDYNTKIATNGNKALKIASSDDPPELILLDIMMPEMDGYEVCERLKSDDKTRDIPVIFLTAKREPEDLVRAFNVGAVDYVVKPFNANELLMRVRTHVELKLAREEIKTLKGIIPICAHCKKIRDDKGFWDQVETYITRHTEARFSHGLCPHCEKELYGDREWYQKKGHKG